MPPRTTSLAIVVLLAAALAAPAQSGSGLALVGGYESVAYYTGFPAPPTALAVDAQHRVYVATLNGTIWRLDDGNGDGVADSHVVFFTNPGAVYVNVTDILWIGSTLYLCAEGKVATLDDTNDDGVADVVTTIISGLPTGYHQNNGLLQDGPNHFLITNGSATDFGPETNPMNAAVLRAELDGSNLSIHATGLRNMYRLARHPLTGDVFGGENEWNAHPTLPLQGDEINIIVPGGDYGYPNFFGDPPPGSPTIAPLITMFPRLAPTGIAFNPDTAISGHQHDAFVTLFASGFTAMVARIPVFYSPTTGAVMATAEPFAAGFVNPIDLEFAADGSMLVLDFSSRILHRIFPLHDARITIDAPPIIGTTVPIKISSPTHPGEYVFMGASHAPNPAVPLGPSMAVFLDVNSPVFALSVTPFNGFFDLPIPNFLDPTGTVPASFTIPAVPEIAGLEFWLAYAVFDAQGAPVATSPAQSLRILAPF